MMFTRCCSFVGDISWGYNQLAMVVIPQSRRHLQRVEKLSVALMTGMIF